MTSRHDSINGDGVAVIVGAQARSPGSLLWPAPTSPPDVQCDSDKYGGIRPMAEHHSGAARRWLAEGLGLAVFVTFSLGAVALA